MSIYIQQFINCDPIDGHKGHNYVTIEHVYSVIETFFIALLRFIYSIDTTIAYLICFCMKIYLK